MLALVGLAWLTTPRRSAQANQFNFTAISEVAVPVHRHLHHHAGARSRSCKHQGPELGLTSPGSSSGPPAGCRSFLDNAPTYVVFFETAERAAPHAHGPGIMQLLGGELHPRSPCWWPSRSGSVFMGANTYIGNGPNFMVKSIAEQSGVKMPSFFGYMALQRRHPDPAVPAGDVRVHVVADPVSPLPLEGRVKPRRDSTTNDTNSTNELTRGTRQPWRVAKWLGWRYASAPDRGGIVFVVGSELLARPLTAQSSWAGETWCTTSTACIACCCAMAGSTIATCPALKPLDAWDGRWTGVGPLHCFGYPGITATRPSGTLLCPSGCRSCWPPCRQGRDVLA